MGFFGVWIIMKGLCGGEEDLWRKIRRSAWIVEGRSSETMYCRYIFHPLVVPLAGSIPQVAGSSRRNKNIGLSLLLGDQDHDHIV